MKKTSEHNIDTSTKVLSGMMDNIDKLREDGEHPFEDGIYRKWFKCKLEDKFHKNHFLGGMKYFVIFNISGNILELKVDLETFYKSDNIDKIRMWSIDGKFWQPIRT